MKYLFPLLINLVFLRIFTHIIFDRDDVGGLNCKVLRLPKFWRMPKPGRGGWVKTKVSWCDGRLLIWFDGDPTRMRGGDSEFQKPLCEQGETWGCCLAKGGQTTLKVSWPRQKSHRLFLQAQTSFLCQQSLTNWVTHRIVLVLFLPFTLQ